MSGVTSSLVSCDKLHHYSYTLVTFCRILIFWLHCRAKEASLATDWVPYLDLPLHCICNIIATLLSHLLDIPGILIALCNNWSKFGSRWVQRPVICPLGTPGESERRDQTRAMNGKCPGEGGAWESRAHWIRLTSWLRQAITTCSAHLSGVIVPNIGLAYVLCAVRTFMKSYFWFLCPMCQRIMFCFSDLCKTFLMNPGVKSRSNKYQISRLNSKQ